MLLKKLAIFGIAFVMVIALGMIHGCSESEKGMEPIDETAQYSYNFSVVYNGESVSGARVIVIFTDGTDTLLYCSGSNEALLDTEKELAVVCGMSIGLSGVRGLSNDGDIVIEVESVPIPDTTQTSQKVAATYWFGVYDTDSHGDVRFRYRYNFRYFGRSTWLPGGWWGNPNPNSWASWNLRDFPSPWKGKKLLVPRRYQWWHQAVYGFSISRTLYLVASS